VIARAPIAHWRVSLVATVRDDASVVQSVFCTPAVIAENTAKCVTVPPEVAAAEVRTALFALTEGCAAVAARGAGEARELRRAVHRVADVVTVTGGRVVRVQSGLAVCLGVTRHDLSLLVLEAGSPLS
jgi:hypothetical protein